jgi:hypothetical protein
MDKTEILQAIRKFAHENGTPPGRTAFESQTGIKMSDWYPHLWLRWGDALIEAGFEPNKLSTATSEAVLIQNYIRLTRDLNHLPLKGEILRRAKTDSSFPDHSAFDRLGGKEKLLAAVLRYCKENPGNEDIIILIQKARADAKPTVERASMPHAGIVYLMKSGRHYKIGHTISVESRERQLAIKIPIPPRTIHSIETDDPVGVEAYWHRRFDSKRGEGEWFDLTPADVSAFKRWKRIA